MSCRSGGVCSTLLASFGQEVASCFRGAPSIRAFTRCPCFANPLLSGMCLALGSWMFETLISSKPSANRLEQGLSSKKLPIALQHQRGHAEKQKARKGESDCEVSAEVGLKRTRIITAC